MSIRYYALMAIIVCLKMSNIYTIQDDKCDKWMLKIKELLNPNASRKETLRARDIMEKIVERCKRDSGYRIIDKEGRTVDNEGFVSGAPLGYSATDNYSMPEYTRKPLDQMSCQELTEKVKCLEQLKKPSNVKEFVAKIMDYEITQAWIVKCTKHRNLLTPE